VQLRVAEGLLRLDAALLRGYLEVAVLDLPRRVAPALLGLPRGEVLPVEEDDRVGGRLARGLGRDARAGVDDRRLRPRLVVDGVLDRLLASAG
jgi:hypothetical protein